MLHQLSVCACDYWWQLEQIPHKHHLNASERQRRVSAEAKHSVDGIDDVASDHRHLIKDDGIHLLSHRNLVRVHLTHAERTLHCEVEAKERVDGLATGVYRSNSGRSQYDKILCHVLTDALEEGSLTCSCPSCEKEALVCLCDEVVRILHFLVCGIEDLFHVFLVFVRLFCVTYYDFPFCYFA